MRKIFVAYKGLSSLMIMVTILALILVVPPNVWAVTGTFLFKFGSFGTGDGQFNKPVGVAVDSSNRIIVSDQFNSRIQVFDSAGNLVTKFGSFGTGDGQFNKPVGVAVDSSNRIIVADTFNDRIQVFDSAGNFITKFGSTGTGDGQFNHPIGVAVDSSNRIIVSDIFNDRIQVFGLTSTPTGVSVGGEIIPVDMTSLFIAGAMTNAIWILPTLGGIAGAAMVLFKIKRRHD